MKRSPLAIAGLLALGCFGGGGAARPQELPPRITAPRAIAPRPPLPAATPPEGAQRPEGGEAVIVGALRFDRYECTHARYARFLEAVQVEGHRSCHPDEPADKDHTPDYWNDPRFAHPDQPVVGVDWFDAYACAAHEARRLPTAAEWDTAARGEAVRRFPWGDDPDPQGYNHGNAEPPWYDDRDGALYPAPVGQYARDRSPEGVQDLMGNVREWCADGEDERREARGQAWYQTYGQPAGDLGQRFQFHRLERSFTLGFRCVADAP